MKINELKYRMYFLTMYNLSPIQQGIQAGHAALEYVNIYGQTNEYKNFINNDKTWIVLNGGTSNDMKSHLTTLMEMGIRCSEFYEPDLNESMSAIAFLADERVWDKENYLDFDKWWDVETGGRSQFLQYTEENYKDWVKTLGGEQNVNLREFLKNKRLV